MGNRSRRRKEMSLSRAWRDGDYHDLVLAVALACWYAREYEPYWLFC